ncbi:MAG: Gfo/Idh/MocA family oxidoreductase [Bryobacterales bacterium]|nr:Gfo/Idh/MocA family oxidoreductase [Bryobacterales bacterium]
MEVKSNAPTRRSFAAGVTAAGLFSIVPRHVLGGQGVVAPSDKVTIAAIGMGRQGMFVSMDLMARPEVQMVAVCDCNEASKDYAEYGENATLKAARNLLGPGYENWGDDLASPGFANLTHIFRTSLGVGGRTPAKRLVEACYGSRKPSGSYKGCNAYADYRELLAKESGVDAVYVATPDHWHAPISIAAMRKGKHVLCQKPMTHSIGEARRMAAVARETKVATSVTVNNPSTQESQTIKRWIEDGAIGAVREVHNWSSRPFWPQGVERPAEAMAVPQGLDWDMWLGPAVERPYHKAYLPFSWRGWVDFGCGSFGDMGCYSFAGLFHILNLTPPTAVESTTSEPHAETYPLASTVHLDFPANGSRKPLRLSWYDGGLMPPRPAGLPDGLQRLFRQRGEGVMYVGDKGYILAGFNGQNPQVFPESKKYVWKPAAGAAREQDRAIGQWLLACKGGPRPNADIISQETVTEALLLGCLAQRIPFERHLWDSANLRVTTSEAATKLVDPPWRGKWMPS